MVPAEGTSGLVPRPEALLSDSNQHSSFSFQLSQTPPSAEVVEEGSLEMLDLDLDDFGDLSEEPVDETGAPAAVEKAIASVPPSALMSDFGGSMQLRGSLPEPSGFSPSFEPTIALKAQSSPLASEGPEVDEVSDVPDEPAPIELVAQGRASAEESVAAMEALAVESAVKPELVPEVAVKAAAVIEAATKTSAVPAIKKIQFPTRSTSRTPGVKAEASPTRVRAIERQKTRFSKSISEEGVRKPLESEPDLATPEDISSLMQPAASESAVGWGGDAPNAREIWQKARKKWSTTSRQALALGGQGLRAGREMASGANEKMRARMRQGAEERLVSEQGLEDAEEKFAEDLPSPSLPKKVVGGSSTGRVLLGLARSSAKKLAAPLSAVAAATLVYLGGSHLLGSEGLSVLSKSSYGPGVPHLGVLEGSEKEGSGSGAPSLSKKQFAAKSDSETPVAAESAREMQVEETEMPQGLSWPGKGLIEVVTSEDELIYVDGVFTGRGPLRRIPVSPGDHEISIRTGGKKRTGVVQVRVNRNTRAVFEME